MWCKREKEKEERNRGNSGLQHPEGQISQIIQETYDFLLENLMFYLSLKGV